MRNKIRETTLDQKETPLGTSANRRKLTKKKDSTLDNRDDAQTNETKLKLRHEAYIIETEVKQMRPSSKNKSSNYRDQDRTKKRGSEHS